MYEGIFLLSDSHVLVVQNRLPLGNRLRVVPMCKHGEATPCSINAPLQALHTQTSLTLKRKALQTQAQVVLLSLERTALQALLIAECDLLHLTAS